MKTLLPEIDSPDKRFHAGNPATGEQGTRVTDTWLNDVQDRVRDVQAEAHYVLLKAGFKPVENQQTQLYEAIVKIIDDNRKKASTAKKGEVQLYSGYDSDSEEMAATPKSIKLLKAFIDALTRNLSNYIPNSKKSSAVDSNSAENVATSAAVKTAYDKGVDAKNAADNAQRTANNAQRTANDGVSKADAAQTSANQAKSAADAAQSSANAANNNANGRISKTDISHATNGTNKAKVASEFAMGELARSFSYQKIGDFEVRKYPDGTMIQTRCIVQNDIHSAEYKYFNWAQAFVATPLIFSKVTTSVNTGHDCDVNVLTKSNNATCYYYEYEHGLLDQGAIRVEFLAIGRWIQ